jgi:hypothetical protein
MSNASKLGSVANGGRARWAHCTFTRIDITPTILRKKFKGLREMGVDVISRCDARSADDAVRRDRSWGRNCKHCGVNVTEYSRRADPDRWLIIPKGLTRRLPKY